MPTYVLLLRIPKEVIISDDESKEGVDADV